MLTIIVLILIALLGYILFQQVKAVLQITVRESHKRIYYMTPIIIAIIFVEVGFEYGEELIHYALFILVALNFIAIPFVSGISNESIFYKPNKRGITGFIPKAKSLLDIQDSQIEKEDDHFNVDFSFEQEVISLRFSNENYDEVQQILERT